MKNMHRILVAVAVLVAFLAPLAQAQEMVLVEERTGVILKVSGQNIVVRNDKGEMKMFTGIPEGVTITCPSQTQIVIEGCSKQAVGAVAAEIRKLRPPEPYKGKGIKYADEIIRRKAGKAFGSV